MTIFFSFGDGIAKLLPGDEFDTLEDVAGFVFMIDWSKEENPLDV